MGRWGGWGDNFDESFALCLLPPASCLLPSVRFLIVYEFALLKVHPQFLHSF
ncbi:MAG: hypothetical protein F6K58_16085 [Symploca sp. SIO2E9]|nr:hypothetical protein [Symploca sp. SIO2E9]